MQWLQEIPRDKNYNERISFLLGEMDDTRNLLLNEIKDFTQEELDFTPDIDKVETIGTLLFHIADVENSWMFEAVEGEELDLETWKYSFPLRQQLDPRQQTGKPLEHYIKLLEEVRSNVKKNMIKYTDKDLQKVFTNRFGTFTLEWVLYHIAQHESHHLGQINILKRLKKYNIFKS